MEVQRVYNFKVDKWKVLIAFFYQRTQQVTFNIKWLSQTFIKNGFLI